MPWRGRDWNEGLAQDLRDQEFAREFLLAAMDEGVPIQIALGKVIRAMGVKEFAGKVRMASPRDESHEVVLREHLRARLVRRLRRRPLSKLWP